MFRGVLVLLSQLQLAVERIDLTLAAFQGGFHRRLAGSFLGLLGLNFTEFSVELLAPLPVSLLPLGQLQAFQLTLVMALFERRSRRPELGEAFVVFGERAIEAGEFRAPFLDRILMPARFHLQRFDFALPSKNSGVRRIGRVKAHAKAAELVALAVDEHCLGGQSHAGQQPRHALDDVVGRKPRRDDTRHRGFNSFDMVGKRFQARLKAQLCIGSGEKGAHPCRRRVLEQSLQQLGVGHLHRMQALAQGRFHGRLPAGFDANFLPQPRF